MNTRHMHALTDRLVAVAIVAAAAATSGGAQQAPSPATPLPPYRSPALALVQPAAGGSVPQDRPVVVFRFAPGEPNDPIDVRSFAVTVDGQDRTGLFQVSVSEAWGSLNRVDHDSSLFDTGPHQLAARICSARGACAELSATVSVVPSAVEGVDAELPRSARRRKVLNALLDAIRKILVP